MENTKRVSITTLVSTELANAAREDDFMKYLGKRVQTAKGMFLRNHPGCRPISEPQFVTRQHPEREIDGELTVDTDVWQYLYNFEVVIETK